MTLTNEEREIQAAWDWQARKILELLDIAPKGTETRKTAIGMAVSHAVLGGQLEKLIPGFAASLLTGAFQHSPDREPSPNK